MDTMSLVTVDTIEIVFDRISGITATDAVYHFHAEQNGVAIARSVPVLFWVAPSAAGVPINGADQGINAVSSDYANELADPVRVGFGSTSPDGTLELGVNCAVDALVVGTHLCVTAGGQLCIVSAPEPLATP